MGNDISEDYLERRERAEYENSPGFQYAERYGPEVFAETQKEAGKTPEEIGKALDGIEADPWIDPVSAFGGGAAVGVRAGVKAGATVTKSLIRGVAAGGAGALTEYPVGAATEKLAEDHPDLALPFNVLTGMVAGGSIENAIEKRVTKALAKGNPTRELIDQTIGKVRDELTSGDYTSDITKQVAKDLKREMKRLSISEAGTAPVEGAKKGAKIKPAEPEEVGLGAEKVEGDKAKPLISAATKEEAEAYFQVKVTDKAGKAHNINLANLETAEDVRKSLQKISTLYRKDITDKTRGVVSNKETAKLADTIGMTPDELLTRRTGQAYNAHEAVAARNLLTASSERLVDLAKKSQGPDASDADKFAFRKHLSLHYGIQAQVSGMTAEAGRALQAFRIAAKSDAARAKLIKEYMDSSGQRGLTDDMAEKIAMLDTPDQINTMIRQIQKAKTSDVLLEAWINGLLSGPQTHATNMLSNALTAIWQVPERLLASQIGRVLPGERAIAEGEAVAQAYGIVTGMRDGIRMAGKAIRTGDPSDLSGKIEARKHRAISAEALGLTGNLGRGVDLLGEFVRLPGRFLTAEDEFFKGVGYRMELQARAFREARAEGLSGDAMAVRMQNIKNDPPDDIHMAAVDASRYQTFTNQLEGVSKGLEGIVAKAPVLRVIVPFIRTPMNIMKFAVVERTPLGILSSNIRADVSAGGARRDLAMARMALGSAVMGTTAVLAAEGNITGAGPINPATRKIWRDNGNAPYSIKLGGKWNAYNRLEPMGMLLGIAAEASEIIGQAEDLDAEEIAAASVMAISRNVTSKTWLRGLSEVLDVMSSGTTGETGYKGKQYIRNLLGTTVPTGLAQLARLQDPVMRDVNSVFDKVKSRIPGWSNELPARRNLWGDPILLTGGLGPDIISPIYTTSTKKDPVNTELLKQQVPISMPSKVVHGVELNPKQYERYVVLAGNESKAPNSGLGLKESLSELIQSRAYEDATDGPDGGKAIMIRGHVQAYRQLAMRDLMEEFPEIEALALELREERQFARTGR